MTFRRGRKGIAGASPPTLRAAWAARWPGPTASPLAPHRRRASRLRRVAPALAVWLAAGCAPALDWREVRPAGTAVVALLPCKPNSTTRTVMLAGQPLRLSMLACKAGDRTWALGSVDAGDPQRVGDVLEALRHGLQTNLQARVQSSSPARVRGATPHAASTRSDLVGRKPDGGEVHARLVLFVHGTQVFEAVVMGGGPPGAAAEPFFEALQVRP